MTCNDVRAAFLTGDETGQFDDHLSQCADCRAAVPELERLRRALADPVVWDEPALSADDLMVALTGSRLSTPVAHVRRRGWLIGVAAALVVVVGVLALLLVPSDPADWTVSLAGAEAAPGASGVLAGWNVDGGSRLVLETRGLERAPSGTVYELWFMSADEAFSAGTFADPANVQLMVGVPWREYPNLLVTLETADGDPTPSATWVLWNTWDEEEA
ncbi:MAG: anti-sigma factor [Actinomycetota bacterium]